MTIETAPAHEFIEFMSPLSGERADRLVRFLAEKRPRTVLDIGCGWAELLQRVLVAAPGSRGLGIDLKAMSIAHGEQLARRRGLSDRLTLTVGDAKEVAPAQTDALVCIGASQVWGPPVDANLPLDYASALSAIRALVPRGARVVYGEGIWSQPPTEHAAAPLSGRLDEFVSLADLTELTVEHGFAPVAIEEASLDEWDEFESGFGAGYAHWLVTHDADDPDAAEVHRRAADQRAGYLRGYRGMLGMAYLSLIAV